MRKLTVILSVLLVAAVFAGCAAAGTLDRIEDTVEDRLQGAAQTTGSTSAAAAKLTREEAEAAALSHAGLTQDAVSGLRSEYEIDDGIPEWEVDFRSGQWEYDYTIHAETGAVLRSDKEYDPPQTAAGSTATQAASTAKLTASEAEAAALAHAGLTAEQVKGLRSEYDVDDGVPEYEVEFHADGWEYNYEIHAETGAIIRSEKDLDD